jgi:3-hydroxyisobutyrate dehydrogenase
MCGHLLVNGHKVVLFTRTKAKAQGLIEQGASWADSPRAVAEQVEVLFTMVGFPQDVRRVYFGEDGILAGTRSGMVLVDMTTTDPRLTQELAAAAQVRGAILLDAPVSGGDVGARQATLSIMVGGDQDALDRVMPLLRLMGTRVLHQGGPGAGQHTKLCNQIVIASTMIGVCESLLYGHKAGLALPHMLESISGGAAACWTLDHLAPRMLARNFDPGFFVEHFVKDLGIALEESRRMGLDLPGLALAHRLYLSVQAQGHGRCGTQALLLALEELSGTTLHVPST